MLRRNDGLEMTGLAAIVIGVALLNLAAAFIVAGLLAVAWANIHDLGR